MPLLFSHNALQIPNLFQSSYALTAKIGFVLFSIMLVAAILHQNFAAMQGQSNYAGLFVRVVLVMSLMVLYERFFIWITYGMDLLSSAIFPREEFEEVISAVFKQIGESKDVGIFMNVDRLLMVALNYLTYTAALVALGVLSWLRFIFLALLFVIGPIVIPVGIYQATSQGIVFWLRSVVGISFWTVVLSILMKVVSVMNLTAVYLPDETNNLSVLAANILFVLLFIAVPLIANMITSGGSISALGSGIIGITTALVTRVAMWKMFHPNRNHLRNFNSTQGGGAGSNPGGSGSSYK